MTCRQSRVDPGLSAAVSRELERRGEPPASVRLWTLSLAAAHPRSGEILLSREDLAGSSGLSPARVTGTLETLRIMKALWLRPGWRQGPPRYFVNPAVMARAAPRPARPADALATLGVALDDWPHCPY